MGVYLSAHLSSQSIANQATKEKRRAYTARIMTEEFSVTYSVIILLRRRKIPSGRVVSWFDEISLQRKEIARVLGQAWQYNCLGPPILRLKFDKKCLFCNYSVLRSQSYVNETLSL